MMEIKVNFTILRQKVQAAENLQEAGEDKMCRKILRDMCEGLLKNLPQDDEAVG